MIPQINNRFEKFDYRRLNSFKKKDSKIIREFLPNGNYIEMTVSKSGKKNGHGVRWSQDGQQLIGFLETFINE
jgi:hypothetical protein